MQPARQIIRIGELKYILPTHNWFKPMLIELQLTQSKRTFASTTLILDLIATRLYKHEFNF